MSYRPPLGDDGAFRSWSGRPRPWGPPDGQWRVWCGGKVIEGLCEVLDEHLAAKRPGVRAAIGCPPWVTSCSVVDRLLALAAFCVVVDKGASFIPSRLNNPEKGFPNVALWRLRDMTPKIDGAAPILGPHDRMPEHELGPVRKLGWSGKEEGKPLLHTKLLVLGDLRINVYGPDYHIGEEVLDFEPRAVWWGSANWTQSSRKHLEFGFFSDDPALVSELTDFATDLIAFSEPMDTTCDEPNPNLVSAEFDDAAMAEAMAEMEEYDAEDDEGW